MYRARPALFKSPFFMHGDLMTYYEFGKQYLKIKKPDTLLTDEECQYLLWNETCYPHGEIKLILKQLMSALRRKASNIKKYCDLCGKIKCNCLEILSKE